MSKLFEEAIDEITDATDKLAGDGIGSEVRVTAMQTALSIWINVKNIELEQARSEAFAKQQAAANSALFGSQPPK